MSPLGHKLMRDLWRMKGQVVAIAMVMAVGVMLLVMMSGLYNSLDETRRAYYERYRLADIFAPVARAPEHLADAIAAIPGVATVQTRVVGSALIALPGQDLPVRAAAVSLPDRGEPRLNAVYLSAGRHIDPNHGEEILLLEGFAKAHGLGPGDWLSVTMNGARRSFHIAGLAQSPEFLYTTAPGELLAVDSRFGVIWMSRSALAATYDMDGAFNEILLSLARNADSAAVIDLADTILDGFGGPGPYGLADQLSNRFVSEEIAGLKASGTVVPPIFLAVAAFLLYIVVNRMVQAEREEIGLMKAFGYTNVEAGSYYFRLVMTIALAGAAMGCLMGIGTGRALIGIYTQYFKFPFLIFELDPAAFVTGVSFSVLSASLGGLLVLRRVFALAPAAAMRPPAPADYSRAGKFGSGLSRFLDQPSRMVLRRLARQPGRMIGAVIGIGTGMSLTVAMLGIFSGFERTIDLAFNVVDRSDATVSFIYPMSQDVVFAIRRIEGVIEAEPMRSVPAIFRNGLNSHQGAITGLIAEPRLSRAIDDTMAAVRMREDGIILTSAVARKLGLNAGETVRVEVREGRQPVLTLPVAAIAESLMGAPTYMEIGALNRALGEPGRVSAVALRIDPALRQEIYRRLRDMPAVAGVSLKSDAEAAFQKQMDQGAGAMRFVMGAVAFVITFGIIYNAARIAFAERARDLASLRVIGFTRAETAFVLLGELAVVVLAALPVGALLGRAMSELIATGFSTDLYQVSAKVGPEAYGLATLFVVGAAMVSGWVVKRDLDRADLVLALKTKE